MRKLLIIAATVSVLLFGLTGIAFADPTGNQGQPSQSCGSTTAPNTPGGGNSSQSTGSPFAGASSAGVYANGVGTGGPNGAITNPTAVSQYDVACFQVSQPHP
jgi:hypothetical protein